MKKCDCVIAVLPDHAAAELAVSKLAKAGFDLKQLSLVGKGFHTEEKVIGFYNMGDRVQFWGARGAFWGGLWSLFFGGVVLTVPITGQVVVLGYLASALVAAVEGAILVGGLSALGAALYSLGIPKDSVLQYEAALKADKFMVLIQGTADDLVRAKTVLATIAPADVSQHAVPKPEPVMALLASSHA
jgi:hypothetical protein